ncbi:MAG: FecR domain-containing protein [Burkholderiales bacterium]|jgi:hypothetical protein|nr:FecR domain-containing protein [Burkholderiales bacterium]
MTLIRFTAVAFFLSFSALSLHATEPVDVVPDSIEYIVQPGDTVSNLSERYLGGRARWGAIEKANPGLDIHKLRPGQTLRLPENRVQSAAKTAKVLKINGSKTQSDGVDLQEGQELAAGAVIEVGNDSFVTLQLNDGSILIVEPNTRARLDELRQLSTGSQRSSVYVDRGRVNVKAAPQTKPGARFEITTPSATTAVRGTQFRVGKKENTATVIEVDEGRVHVASASANKKQKSRKSLDKGVNVAAGQGSIVADGQPPSAPVFLLPPPDLSALPGQYTQPVLEIVFPPVANAVAYRVSVARNVEFNDLIALNENTLPQLKIVDIPDGQYFLRACAISADGLHGIEASATFLLHAHPEPPFATSPVLDNHVAAGTVTLNWTAPQDAAAYDILITRDGQPLPVIERHRGTSYALDAAPGLYLWQLATRDAADSLGPFSRQSAFTVIEPPSAPVAQAALAGDDNTLTLAWEGTSGQTYHWQLAADSDFSSIQKEGNTPTPNIELAALPAGTYFIRLRTTTSEGVEGPYGGGQKFVIPEQESAPPFWIFLLLLPPLLAL